MDEQKDNVEEAPANAPTDKPEDTLQTVRTYRSDVMEAVKGGKHTVSSIVLAEQKRRLTSGFGSDMEVGEEKKINWNLIIIGASVLLVLAGLGAIGTLLFFKKEEVPTIPPPLVLPQESIFSDREKELPVSRFTRQEILGLVSFETKQENIPTNQVQTFVFSKQVPGTTPEGAAILLKERIGIKEIFAATQGSVPQALLRAIDDPFIFGVYSFRGNNPFLILTTNVYESAFSGMLQWEKTILQDLAPLFGVRDGGGGFTDVVIKNRDARILENDAGETVLLYSFLDKKTLIITTDNTTFDELVRRFLTPREVLR